MSSCHLCLQVEAADRRVAATGRGDRSVRRSLADDHCIFLSDNERDVLPGSGLIVPRRHCETVFDLSTQEWASTHALLAEVKARLDADEQPDGYNLGWNCGSVAGQSIFHAHLHVIPRHADEPLAGRGIRHWLKQPDNRRRSRR